MQLPFDDDYIPFLFKKIKSTAQFTSHHVTSHTHTHTPPAGQYTIPSYVSADARDLMQKCMTVDPLKRITIIEIKSVGMMTCTRDVM